MIRSKYNISSRHAMLALATLTIFIGIGIIGLQVRNCSWELDRGSQLEDADVTLWDDNAPLNWNAEMVSKSELVHALAMVARLDPVVPVSDSCQPPPLEPEPSCSGQSAFTGRRLERPRRIVQMLLISFEGDTLEIALQESHDVVDFIFLVESTRTHSPKGKEGRSTKPLMWEALRHTERFRFVSKDKLFYIVVDDVDIQKAVAAGEDDIWSVEALQTIVGVQKIKNWANSTSALDDNDIFISGDVDEVIRRDTLNQMKWCELSDTLFSGALWMPLGNLDMAYRTDHSAPDLPYTYTLPTVFTWRVIASGEDDGRRKFSTQLQEARGASWKFVKGGVHLTNPAFVPNQILKQLSGTEYDGIAEIKNYTIEDIDKEQAFYYSLESQPAWKKRQVRLNELDQTYSGWLEYVPWFLKCNPKRYPYWFGNTDQRNRALLYVLKKLSMGQTYDMAEYLHQHL